MKRGDSIIIREINNGVMIEPNWNQGVQANSPNSNEDLIAFQDAESFTNWIKTHFSIYTQPSWDNNKADNTAYIQPSWNNNKADNPA